MFKLPEVNQPGFRTSGLEIKERSMETLSAQIVIFAEK
jgi:hypothetical protein